MNRRTFLAALAAAPAGSLAGARPSRALVRPPRLRPRSVVGLAAPGGIADDALIQESVRNLESLGFTVKTASNIRAAYGGYAGAVAERVAGLQSLFTDREVAAIWTVRGGSGCTQILPHLDYALLRRHAKILVGYSDVTALHLALLRHAGLVSFHGPVASSTFSDYSVENLRAVLMEPLPQRRFLGARENEEKARSQPQFAQRAWREGEAEGRLVGGNLSVVAALAGTPYGAEGTGALVFLEEVSEPPYRVDRMLTQLRQAGTLARAAGVMLGVFQKCEPKDPDPSLTLAQVLDDNLSPLRVPAAYGFSFGHIPHQLTLPVGVRARMDSRTRTLTLLEPAVSG